MRRRREDSFFVLFYVTRSSSSMYLIFQCHARKGIAFLSPSLISLTLTLWGYVFFFYVFLLMCARSVLHCTRLRERRGWLVVVVVFLAACDHFPRASRDKRRDVLLTTKHTASTVCEYIVFIIFSPFYRNLKIFFSLFFFFFFIIFFLL